MSKIVYINQFLTHRLDLRLVLDVPHSFGLNSLKNNRYLDLYIVFQSILDAKSLRDIPMISGSYLEISDFPSLIRYPSNDLWYHMMS